jgi:hypothetical protein
MRQEYTDFNEFVNINFGIIRVSILLSTKREDSTCTCTAFYKRNKCKHIIGILARKDLYPNSELTIPQEAKNIPIGQKKGRDRPALAKPALVRQPVPNTAHVSAPRQLLLPRWIQLLLTPPIQLQLPIPIKLLLTIEFQLQFYL